MGRNRLSPIQLALTATLGGGACARRRCPARQARQQSRRSSRSRRSPSGGLGNVALQAPTTKGLTPERIYRHDAPGVVQITATSVTQTSDPFSQQPSTQTEQSLGSGFVIDKTGHIVTNYHVVQGASKVQVSFSGQDQLTATVVGSDPSTDTAVLKVDAHARAFTPLPLGDSDACGRRRSRSTRSAIRSASRGRSPAALVSAVQRQIEAPNTLRDRSRDPDRRCDQPRQLGRPADRRRRPGDRRHVADLDRQHRRSGQRRHRLRDPDQHRPQRCSADHHVGQGRARATRGQHVPADGAARAALQAADRAGDARADDPEGQRRRQGRTQGRQDEGDRRRRLVRDRRRHHRQVDGALDRRPTSSCAMRSRRRSPATRSSSRSTATAPRRLSP